MIVLNGSAPCVCGNEDGTRHVYDEHEEGGGACTVTGCDCLGFEADESGGE